MARETQQSSAETNPESNIPNESPEGTALPTISIIIPTKNRIEKLRKTLVMIVAQESRAKELVIVDQSDENYENEIIPLVAGYPDMHLIYIWGPDIPGLVAARTIGVERASGDIIFFCDDDITLNPDCTASLAERYRDNPDYAGICGVDVGGVDVPWWLVLARRSYMLGPFYDQRSLMNKRYLSIEKPQSVRLVSGGYMSYRRWVFDEFQFEGQLWGHRWTSSIDFSHRVSQKYTVVIDPKVRALHRDVYGSYGPEEFVQVRISGTFFFFQRNVAKTPFNWLCFMAVIGAIFIKSISRGIGPHPGSFFKTMGVFFREFYRGLTFLRKPFDWHY